MCSAVGEIWSELCWNCILLHSEVSFLFGEKLSADMMSMMLCKEFYELLDFQSVAQRYLFLLMVMIMHKGNFILLLRIWEFYFMPWVLSICFPTSADFLRAFCDRVINKNSVWHQMWKESLFRCMYLDCRKLLLYYMKNLSFYALKMRADKITGRAFTKGIEKLLCSSTSPST